MAQEVNLNIQPKLVNVPVDKCSDTVYIYEVFDEASSPVELNGFSARMQLRHYPSAKTVLDEMTTENGRLSIEDNKVYLKFPYEATVQYKFDKAVYDLVLETPSGRYRVAQGEITFDPEVTR